MSDDVPSSTTATTEPVSLNRFEALVFRMVDGMNWVLRMTVGLMLFVMVVIVFLQILARFALPKLGIVISIPWTEELARYLMIWCIFLGAAAASRSGDLIAMDTLTTALAPSRGWKVKLFAYVVTILFFAFLIYIGVEWMGFGLVEFSTVMNTPMYVVYMAMPVGAVLAIINILVRSYEGHRQMGKSAKIEPDGILD
ncbi:MAG: TRAP transporter small permease [Candidimonas sp.]